MEPLQYPHKSISSVEALSGLLQIPAEDLIEVAKNRHLHYKKNKPEIKSNGKERITYTLSKRLKFIQKRIKAKILAKVKYPEYLQGSIKDSETPRTYDGNVKIHSGGRLIISEDVSEFFDSISEERINQAWKILFRFTPEVSALLTQLTTYDGFVPQGGVTSSYLANIALWDVEHPVFEKIESMGFTYTRYVDDINMSSTQKILPEEDIQTAIKLVYLMMRKAGIRPNRKKHQIMTKSVPIKIHKLNVNAGRPTMPKYKRDRIRLETYNLRKLAESCLRKGKKYYTQHISISGKIRELSKFHAAEGRKLMKSIDGITPLYIPKQKSKGQPGS